MLQHVEFIPDFTFFPTCSDFWLDFPPVVRMACEIRLLESEATTGFFVLLGEQGNKTVLSWVMKEGLISSRYECPKCKKGMRLVERKGTIDGFEWRCRVQSKENPHFVCRSVRKGLKLSHSLFRVIDSNDPSYLALENMTEPADYKYYKNVQTTQELILRTGNKKFHDITILLEHTEKAGSIPKSNPHLLHAELKNKIPRHDNITHMYFTRSGKIKISISDPACAVQITAIDQILNTPVKANIIWEGFTSRFLLFDIPTNVHLADVVIELKNSNDLDIVEIRFVKPNSRQEASRVLITILGINTPECVKRLNPRRTHFWSPNFFVAKF
ncbi:uncharacterized protein TNCV_3531961 [Trichonephila clavipes]|nr:uncharacterized protein TNCV_3531961 [Trichonephila clavipes]